MVIMKAEWKVVLPALNYNLAVGKPRNMEQSRLMC